MYFLRELGLINRQELHYDLPWPTTRPAPMELCRAVVTISPRAMHMGYGHCGHRAATIQLCYYYFSGQNVFQDSPVHVIVADDRWGLCGQVSLVLMQPSPCFTMSCVCVQAAKPGPHSPGAALLCGVSVPCLPTPSLPWQGQDCYPRVRG